MNTQRKLLQINLRKKAARKKRSSDRLQEDRQMDSTRKRKAKDFRSSDKLQQDQQRNNTSHKRARESTSSDRLQKDKETDSIRKRKARGAKSSVQLQQDRQKITLTIKGLEKVGLLRGSRKTRKLTASEKEKLKTLDFLINCSKTDKEITLAKNISRQ